LEKYNKSEIINLYDEKYKLDFLSFEDKKEIPKNDTIKFIQEKIISCEEIIFVFPVWWGGMPAIMKNMFDSVFISGFAFKY
jgi:NAD(P)H dehydrogenase (quinone)